jgi:hypothetical protein
MNRTPSATGTAEASAPTQPEQWADRDRHIRTQILLPTQQAAALQVEPRCGCGGDWRYLLLPQAHRPIWRCLHCGGLHRGDRLILEEQGPVTG